MGCEHMFNLIDKALNDENKRLYSVQDDEKARGVYEGVKLIRMFKNDLIKQCEELQREEVPPYMAAIPSTRSRGDEGYGRYL